MNNQNIGLYELMWNRPHTSFKSMSKLLSETNIDSFYFDEHLAYTTTQIVKNKFEKSIGNFSICMDGMSDFPEKLKDEFHYPRFLYYQGNWNLLQEPSISVIGTRKPSNDGINNTIKLTQILTDAGFTIISGLADGIDTAAHMSAMHLGGNTIAVIGTPLCYYYPKSNQKLQKEIAEKHLLISQIPLLKYESQNWKKNKFFFPERNKTMSALSQASVIVEAGEKSGTISQANAAISQGRKVFILAESCKYSWTYKLMNKGAIKIDNLEDILSYF